MKISSMLLYIACVAMLSACGGMGYVRLGELKDNPPETYSFVDERPAIEHSWKAIAYNPSNPLSQVKYINHGDKNFVPDRVTVLRNHLAASAADSLKGKNIVLKSFFVHEYPIRSMQASRAAASGAVSPILPSILEPAGDSDSVVVGIEISVDGRVFKSIAKQNYILGMVMANSNESGAFQKAVKTAVNAAIDDLVFQINQENR